MAKIIKSGVGRSGVAYKATQGKGGMVSWHLAGVDKVTANINKELLKIKSRSMLGLKVAAAEVLRSADTTPPKVPADTGVLRSSTFIDPKTRRGDPYVELGYGTKYAAAVHEMMQSISGKPINWKRPGSGPKFLEASLKRNSNKVVQIVGQYAKI